MTRPIYVSANLFVTLRHLGVEDPVEYVKKAPPGDEYAGHLYGGLRDYLVDRGFTREQVAAAREKALIEEWGPA